MPLARHARTFAAIAILSLWQMAAGQPTNAAAADHQQPKDNADIYGRWKLSKVLDYADITALTERQARALLGKPVVISKDAFVFNGEACTAPPYARSVEETALTMREKGHVSSVRMGLPDPVTVIDAGCTDIFLKAPGKIVVHWRGFYFDAVRGGR